MLLKGGTSMKLGLLDMTITEVMKYLFLHDEDKAL